MRSPARWTHRAEDENSPPPFDRNLNLEKRRRPFIAGEREADLRQVRGENNLLLERTERQQQQQQSKRRIGRQTRLTGKKREMRTKSNISVSVSVF